MGGFELGTTSTEICDANHCTTHSVGRLAAVYNDPDSYIYEQILKHVELTLQQVLQIIKFQNLCDIARENFEAATICFIADSDKQCAALCCILFMSSI